MVSLKTANELSKMKKAGEITANALHMGGRAISPGITTGELDRIIHAYITKRGASPSFLGYGGFPASACISVNQEVIHGIPGKRVIHEGDIVSIDVGAELDGWQGDSAFTFVCGTASAEAIALMEATRLSLESAIAVAVPGNRIGDISNAVQTAVEPLGFSVVRDFVGHGIGRGLHEAPEVPNYGKPGHGVRLMPGMVLAIEPMINQGVFGVKILADDWTVVTADGKLSAHYEHTVAITNHGSVILTEVTL